MTFQEHIALNSTEAKAKLKAADDEEPVVLPRSVLDDLAVTDLPEGVGTRHRAAVGITEETDAVVIVVSEETGTISIVMAGEMLRGLDAPHLRVALREILGNERRELPTSEEIARPLEVAGAGEAGLESKSSGV